MKFILFFFEKEKISIIELELGPNLPQFDNISIVSLNEAGELVS
jgi:hypothetical protein